MSGEQSGTSYNLESITDQNADSGVAASDLLRTLTEQTIRGEWSQLTQTRDRASGELGAQACTDVLTVAAAFNGITRVADATGIPLDHNTVDATTSMRAAVGIDAFDYQEKSRRYE